MGQIKNIKLHIVTDIKFGAAMGDTLAEMTVDEFFERGLDGDVSDDEDDVDGGVEDKEQETAKKALATSHKVNGDTKTNSKHKNQLQSLKDKDPEFYKFLQENDEDLLDFSGSEEDDDDEEDDKDEEDEDNEEKEGYAGDADLQEEEGGNDSENDVEDEDDGEEIMDGENEPKDEKKKRKVTEKMLSRRAEGLEQHSLKSLKFVFRAFHAAVHSLSPEDDETKKKSTKSKDPVYSVDTGSMYNKLMKLCLKYSVNILNKNLTTAKHKKFTNTHLPSSHKSWSNIKVALKQYLCDILQLLRVHTDESALTILLKHCQNLCVFYACFPKISKMLLKRLIRMWSSGEEHVRVLAFLCIRTLSFLTPRLYEFIVKKLYIGFVRNSKFVNLKTKPVIVFMKNSLVEMFSYNEAATYKQGFLYIRQLAITLRNAIVVKKKDSFQAVYNWQYISALQLWSQVVSDLYGDVLKPLVYPVVQINLGVIKLIPAARYYPLRFHCVDSLNHISKKSGVYIPTATLVLQALESNEFLRKPKSSEKIPDFSGVLKMSKSHLRTKGFQDVTIDLAVESLLEHYVIFSSSIAFPELIFPVCHRLKHLIKTSHIFKLCKDMKTVVEKLQVHGETMRLSRNQVTFSPKDIEQVRQWEEARKDSKTVLSEFLQTWQDMKKLTDSKQSHHDEDLEIPIEKETSKSKDRKRNKTKDNLPAKKKAKKDKEAEPTSGGNDEDIVEDYNLSDDDM